MVQFAGAEGGSDWITTTRNNLKQI